MLPSSCEGLVWDVCQTTLQLDDPAHCAVSFLTSGGFNKIYVMDVGYDQRFVLRVSLPVDPRHKMAGEVATLRWLSQHSTVPVPGVIALDDIRDNKIGFE
ncbi:hypothetical protein QWA68_005389 [Fusarium oxysporum]|nr:hypothetical protein QWA68_005389 [Fusarium oxysporum]